jgi:hypothetical protein
VRIGWRATNRKPAEGTALARRIGCRSRGVHGPFIGRSAEKVQAAGYPWRPVERWRDLQVHSFELSITGKELRPANGEQFTLHRERRQKQQEGPRRLSCKFGLIECDSYSRVPVLDVGRNARRRVSSATTRNARMVISRSKSSKNKGRRLLGRRPFPVLRSIVEVALTLRFARFLQNRVETRGLVGTIMYVSPRAAMLLTLVVRDADTARRSDPGQKLDPPSPIPTVSAGSIQGSINHYTFRS